jgi:hypothetical protein
MKHSWFKLTIALSLMTPFAQAAQEPSAPAAAPQAIYNVVVSNASGPNDLGAFIMRRMGDVVSFKFCPARTKEGTVTPAGKLRALRFDFAKPLAKATNTSEIYQQVFEDPSCQLIGAPAYGFAHAIETSNRGPNPGYFFKYRENLEVAQVLAAGAAFFGSLAEVFHYKVVFDRDIPYRKALARPDFNKFFAIVAGTGALVAAGIQLDFMAGENVQGKLNWYKDLLAHSYDQTNALTITNGPMDDFVSAFRVGLSVALKQNALLPL